MRRWIASAAGVAVLALAAPQPHARAAERVAEDAASVREVAKRKQRVRVIARLKRRDAAGTVSEHALRGRMAGAGVARFERLGDLPHVALEVDERQLDALVASGEVERIRPDRLLRPRLAESAALVGAPVARGLGAGGDGQVVAILDTGVDAAHPFLRGKVLQEACFSSTVRTDRAASLCRGARPSGVGTGAAAPCPSTLDGCHHGTHVAGIVAGEGRQFSGVAPGARIVSVQVYSRVADAEACGWAGADCVLAYESDLIRGLNHVRSLTGRYRIAAANLSLSGPAQGGGACDDEPIKAAIDALRARGVATVVATGNDYADDAVGYPGCVSSAIAVASSTDSARSERVSSFSNFSPLVDLVAPGETILSSVPGGRFRALSGTSMAAPHVAGAWAALKSADPRASVSRIEGLLESTGRPLRDAGARLTRPRLDVGRAAAALRGRVPTS
jgi:subtilisin family serine protease